MGFGVHRLLGAFLLRDGDNVSKHSVAPIFVFWLWSSGFKGYEPCLNPKPYLGP